MATKKKTKKVTKKVTKKATPVIDAETPFVERVNSSLSISPSIPTSF